MKKPTFEQLKRLKELEGIVETKLNAEQRAIFTSFLQTLKDIDVLSHFYSDFQSKLSELDNTTTPIKTEKQLIQLMKYSVKYYEA